MNLLIIMSAQIGRISLICSLLFIQMAGAMSEEGKSLEEMASFLREAVKEIGWFSFPQKPNISCT